MTSPLPLLSTPQVGQLFGQTQLAILHSIEDFLALQENLNAIIQWLKYCMQADVIKCIHLNNQTEATHIYQLDQTEQSSRCLEVMSGLEPTVWQVQHWLDHFYLLV